MNENVVGFFFAECVVQSIKMGGKRSSYLSISKFLYIRTTFFMMKPAFLSIYYFPRFPVKGKNGSRKKHPKRKSCYTSIFFFIQYIFIILLMSHIFYLGFFVEICVWWVEGSQRTRSCSTGNIYFFGNRKVHTYLITWLTLFYTEFFLLYKINR